MSTSSNTARLQATQTAHFSVLPAGENAVADPVESAIRTIQIEWEALSALVGALDGALEEPFRRAIDVLLSASRVVVTGMGKSGHIGRKIDATFSSTGTQSEFVHPAEASHGDLGKIQPGDAVIALSYSGNTKELADIIAHTRRFAIPLIAITGNSDSELGRRSDICLTLPPLKEACPNDQAPTTSTTVTLALGDALAVALMEARGFTREHFRVYHPGGKLGAELVKVSELMQHNALPLVKTGAAMMEALEAINAAGLGAVGITGHQGELLGIITDGDIRRANAKEDFAGWRGITVDTVMGRNPRTTAADKLAGEAVKLMQERAINLLIVTDAQNVPVGILHIQQCMKAGLV